MKADYDIEKIRAQIRKRPTAEEIRPLLEALIKAKTKAKTGDRIASLLIMLLMEVGQ